MQDINLRGANFHARAYGPAMPKVDDPSAQAVGERIRILRDALEMSQTDFAKQAGLARAAVATWERGAQRPGIALAQKITDRYGVTLDWLFLGRTHTLRHDMAGLLSDTTGE